MALVETVQEKKMPQAKPGDPCTMVLFGVTGDLTKRKLLPALYNLAVIGLLPKNFAIVGISSRDMSDQDFKDLMSKDIKDFATREVDQKIWDWFLERMSFFKVDYDSEESYVELKNTLASVDSRFETKGNFLYYLAIPPTNFSAVAEHLSKVGLTKENKDSWRRVIFEKPFGNSLDSARKLNKELLTILEEDQIFRIDHYLGKETVQNIMVFRFANGIFEPVWNHHYVDSVQITVAESVGVEGRGVYYDKAGALRDMVENHMFQMLTLTTMEPPSQFRADLISNQKQEVLTAIRPFTDDRLASDVVRGQYKTGTVQGKHLNSYRNEPSVDNSSTTETFVALKVFVDNARWRGVPFYLRTGKALGERGTEIAIQFKTQPLTKFPDVATEHLGSNTLIIRIQPDEGIRLHFAAKVPGPVLHMDMVDMDFRYVDYFGREAASGYETLIYDCILGDHTLYTRADNLETGWKIVEPILDYWKEKGASDLYFYKAGSWGPLEADEMLHKDGRFWKGICKK